MTESRRRIQRNIQSTRAVDALTGASARSSGLAQATPRDATSWPQLYEGDAMDAPPRG